MDAGGRRHRNDAHGIARVDLGLQDPSQLLPMPLRREFKNRFRHRWQDRLDHCHGECELRDQKLATLVANSLRHFDEDRYLLTDFVIIPNHVHLLAAFPDESSMLKQCESWKHYTATQINRELGRSGRFWQQDGFDHLVRTEEQFRYLRGYVQENPSRAGLMIGEYDHYSRSVM